MVQIKIIFVGLISFSLIASAVPGKKNRTFRKQIEEKWNCLTFYQKLGAGALVTGAITAGLIGLSRSSSERLNEDDEKKKPNPPRGMPEVAKTALNEFKTERELFSAISDITDYFLDKYGENPKFPKSLSKFVTEFPLESMAAFRARFPEKVAEIRTSKELYDSLGSQSYYTLAFAWIITEVYNQKERDENQTLRDVVVKIEKVIQSQ